MPHTTQNEQPRLIVFQIDPYGPIGLPLAADILSHPGIHTDRVYLGWRLDHHRDKHVTTAIVAMNAADATLIALTFADFEPEVTSLTDLMDEGDRHCAAKIVFNCVSVAWGKDKRPQGSVWIPRENGNSVADAYYAAQSSDEFGYGVRLDVRANPKGGLILDIKSFPFGPAETKSFAVNTPSYPPLDVMGR